VCFILGCGPPDSCVTQDVIFCAFPLSSMHVLVQLQRWLPKINVHQHLWNSLVTTPTTTVDVHSLCAHAGVDGINFVLKSYQQYSIILYPLRNVSILPKVQVCPRTPHWLEARGREDY
jgi:hypothetical protein